MKRILMFHRENFCYGSLNAFSDIIAAHIRRRGIEVDFFDIAPHLTKMPDKELLLPLTQAHYDAALAINAVGQQDYRIDGKNLYEVANIPFFNYIVDHPVGHLVDLQSELTNNHVICLDLDHVEYLHKYCPHVASADFLPLGGLDGIPKFDKASFMVREYDIVFTGTRGSLSKMESEISEYKPAVRKIVVQHIEYMLDHRDVTLEDALIQVLSDLGICDLLPEEYLYYSLMTTMTNRYLKAYLREEVIRYLLAADIPIHIFGDGWDELTEEFCSHAVLHSPIDYLQTAELYRHAKIVLNVMPLFKNGSHDRIPTAMLNGAAVLTDHSRYLGQALADQLLFYDINEPWNVPSIVRILLDHPAELICRAKAGYDCASQTMTWDIVTGKLLDIMEKYRGC